MPTEPAVPAGAWTDLEREYSPSSMVPSLSAELDRYRIDSERARRTVPFQTHSYGPGRDETLDVFGAGAGSPVVVFVHGGYWQELSKDDSSFPAGGFRRQGVTYAALEYTLAPAATLESMIDQVTRALAWIAGHAGRLGIDAKNIVVAGSSAGAHLGAAAVLRTGGSSDRPPVAGLVLLSGIYDLVPLVDTYINDAVGLDHDTATRLSPLRMLDASRELPPLLACWGEHETVTSRHQSRAFADAWRRHGGSATTAEIRGRNHFDVLHDLADPSTQLGDLVRTQQQEWACR